MTKNYKRLLIFSIVFIVAELILFMIKIPFTKGIGIWGIFAFLLYVSNKNSVLSKLTIENAGIKEKIIIAVTCFILILFCVIPMDLSPFWNGQYPQHRNQYEVLADSIIGGHIYMNYDDVDPKLLAMENPYDNEERHLQGVDFHWDHAFYNGHYYMYFGVVPVFMLFIPFKLLLGKNLVTFHATQFYVAFAIIAFFILFYLLAKKFFPKMSFGTYLLSSIAICLITIGYCVQAPALYCTAISSGICLMLWSILLFFYAVYYAKKEWSQVLVATFAALCGSLAFGCRPPVAIANIVAIPLAVTYAKNYKGKHIIRNFIIIAIPYIIVGALLMTYNYLRFENPFEFGQAFQLTSDDQTGYSSFIERFDIFRIIAAIFENFFTVGTISNVFPYVFYGGFLITYPIMWLFVPYFSQDRVRYYLKQNKLTAISLFLLLDAVIVTVADVFWSPGLCERYRLDAYFAVGILMFILLGSRVNTVDNKARSERVITVFAVLSIFLTFLIFLYPNDGNYTYIYPEKLAEIKNILFLGFGSN